jgi:hypothetical protein
MIGAMSVSAYCRRCSLSMPRFAHPNSETGMKTTKSGAKRGTRYSGQSKQQSCRGTDAGHLRQSSCAFGKPAFSAEPREALFVAGFPAWCL